jgi:SAM-dependent methyltransferase
MIDSATTHLERSIDAALERARDRFRRLAPWHKWYALPKIRMDPCYRAVARHVPAGTLTVDLGSGIGILASVLAELGEGRRVHGIEFDPRKHSASLRATAGLATVTMVHADIESAPIPDCQVVAAIDVLHYFTPDRQVRLLRRIAESLAPCGRLLIRETDGSRNGGVRFTRAFDRFSTFSGWNRGAKAHYRFRADWLEQLAAAGFRVSVSDVSGSFNPGNMLLLAEKA